MNRDVADDTELTSTLDSLDDAVNYMRWIVDLARPALAGPILEVGAGHGTFTAAFAEIAPVHAVEPGAHGRERLRERFAGDQRVTITAGTIDEVAPESVFGSAVMINVLEHIRDDVAALTAIRSRLAADGRIAIWVPAFQLLYSDFDRKLGHHRRYRKAGLQRVAEAAGFRVDDIRYVNAPGFLSWLFITRVCRQQPTAGPLVTIFDRFVVPVVRRIESLIAPPFGQSVLMLATNARA
jgi:SAM-dependent methyltransferase